MTVDAGTRVEVNVLSKSPFAACSIEQKRTDIAAPSFSEELLKLIGPLAGAFTGVGPELVAGEFQAEPADLTIKDVRNARDAIESAINDVSFRLDAVQSVYQMVAVDLDGFYRETYTSADERRFHADRAIQLASVDAAIDLGLPSTDSLKEALESYKGIIKEAREQLASPFDPNAFSDPNQAAEGKRRDDLDQGLSNKRDNLATIFESARSKLGGFDGLRKHLGTARAALLTTQDYLTNLSNAKFDQSFELIQDRNAKVSVTVRCKHKATGEDLHKGLGFTVKFQDLPRVTMSIGALISFVDKREFGANSTLVTRPEDMNATTQAIITETTSKPQIAPFSFLNLRLARWKLKERDVTVNFSNGFGVNTNSGENEAEFATGIAVGIGGVHLFGGAHFARPGELSGGFQAGDRVADKFAVPIQKPWETGVGFGISYRLPLP